MSVLISLLSANGVAWLSNGRTKRCRSLKVNAATLPYTDPKHSQLTKILTLNGVFLTLFKFKIYGFSVLRFDQENVLKRHDAD